MQAAQRLGRRAVLLTPHREQVPASLPPDMLWLPYVPLRTLLPRAAALVHHGGIGTTAEALRAGVPQVIVPLAYDQFDNAARVEALAAGAMRARAAPPGRARARWPPRCAGCCDSDAIRAGCARAARLLRRGRGARRWAPRSRSCSSSRPRARAAAHGDAPQVDAQARIAWGNSACEADSSRSIALRILR